jgi:hypothetical protein
LNDAPGGIRTPTYRFNCKKISATGDAAGNNVGCTTLNSRLITRSANRSAAKSSAVQQPSLRSYFNALLQLTCCKGTAGGESNFGNFTNHDVRSPMRLWDRDVFMLDRDSGEQLGGSGSLGTMATPKMYPKKTLASRINRERSMDAKFVDCALKSGIF